MFWGGKENNKAKTIIYTDKKRDKLRSAEENLCATSFSELQANVLLLFFDKAGKCLWSVGGICAIRMACNYEDKGRVEEIH